eukprot:2437071-Prymnesium_polylepis.1
MVSSSLLCLRRHRKQWRHQRHRWSRRSPCLRSVTGRFCRRTSNSATIQRPCCLQLQDLDDDKDEPWTPMRVSERRDLLCRSVRAVARLVGSLDDAASCASFARSKRLGIVT